MGGHVEAVYTEEQQRLWEWTSAGQKVEKAAVKASGPAWTRGDMEPPAGEEDMGGHVEAVYTEEQQRRLGVDRRGRSLADQIATTYTEKSGDARTLYRNDIIDFIDDCVSAGIRTRSFDSHLAFVAAADKNNDGVVDRKNSRHG